MVWENWKELNEGRNYIRPNRKIEPDRKEIKDELKSPGRRRFLEKAFKVMLGTAAAAALPSEAWGVLKKAAETKKSEAKKENFNAEKMAEEILRVYNSKAISRRLDSKVFTTDFFIAQQFQESRGDKDKKSSAGAVGVYQNKPESVVDVINYLDFLRKHTRNLAGENRCDYSGPEEISLEKAKKISNLFLEKENYGRAAGKLFLLAIHDKESPFNNYPNADVFRSKSPEKQQALLLLAYHDGPPRRLNPERASLYAKEYVTLVKGHMKTIADLRNHFEKEGMSRNLNYAILLILRELDRGENRHKKEEVISHWVKKLKEAHAEKEGKNSEKFLSDEEVRKLFA